MRPKVRFSNGKRLVVAGMLMILPGLISAGPALGATFYVDQLTDDDGACTPGACSLREAALAANALPGVDILELAPGVHELTIPGINESFGLTGDVNFREPVELHGSSLGKTVVDGNGIDGIFDFFPFFNSTEAYVLRDIELRNGSRTDHNGGAIYAHAGHLTIERCVFDNNYAIQGGAISLGNMQTSIRDSTFLNNQAGFAGGAIERTSLMAPIGLLIENTTISGNSSLGGGAAISSSGSGTLTLRSSTIVDNSSPSASALRIHDVPFDSDLVIESSLIEGSCTLTNIGFRPTSLGGNLQSPDGFCYLEHPSDQTVADFLLGPLEPSEHGYTHTLLPGSPAIDAAAECPPFDQRGAPRPQDGDGDGDARCDSGAFELGTPNGLADVPALTLEGWLALAAGLALSALFLLRRG